MNRVLSFSIRPLRSLPPQRPRLSRQTASAAPLSVGLAVSLALAVAVSLWSTPAAQAQALAFAGGSQSLGSANVCNLGLPAPCSTTLALTYNVTGGGILGTPAVLTQGAPNSDFTLAAGNTCEGTVAANTTCTVTVQFAPLAPGPRNGAVQIVDNAGNVLAATNVSGTGNASAIAFNPALQKPIGSGFNLPTGIALDGNGNAFVADSSGEVYEVLAAGGYTTVKTVGSGLSQPGSVAVDGSGNLFVTDFANDQVYEILAAGGYTTVKTIAPNQTFGGPDGIALDGSGNVFVADYQNQAVYEITAASGYATVNPLGNGFAFGAPAAVAVDGSGNVYVADSVNHAVYEIMANGGYVTVNTLSTAFVQPLGVAVDAGGDVFVTNASISSLQEILTTGTVVTLGSGFIAPYGVAVDANGNVYVTDAGVPSVSAIERSQPPSFSFATTNAGGTSTDSPQAVQIENSGNEPLTGTAILSDALDFTVVPGPGTVPDCNGVLSLNPGAQCNASLSFTPQSGGALTSAFTLSNNALNGAPSTQAVPLTGTGTGGVQPAISGISPNYGAPAALIQIAGTNFGATQGSSSVTVGGAPSYIVSWSNTIIAILVPSRATTGNLAVNVGGAASNGVPFTFYPYPSISGFTPSGGAAGTAVTITGVGLQDGGANGSVTFNGTPASILTAASTSIQVLVPAGATTGPIAIRANGITVHSSTTFEVGGTGAAITSISPNYGAPAALIQIAGTNFGATQGSSSVTVGGAPSYIVSWSNTMIAILVPSRATTGNIAVNVGGVASNGVPFTFYPYPSISGFTPSGGAAGTAVTITGVGIQDGGANGSVSFNGTPASILTATSTSVQALVPAGATTGPITIRANGITVHSSNNFVVGGSGAAINSISPNYGAPAALIQIAGTNFGATQGSSSVTVGGAPSYVVSWSNTQIAILVPSRATTGNIAVTVGGAASNGVPFTFYPYPSISSFTPSSAAVGATVTINGTAIQDGGANGSVSFNGTPASILAATSTSIQVVVPAGATTGPINIHANGVTVQSPTVFTVAGLATPVIAGISPDYGAPSAFLSIAGTNFGATPGAVTVGGAPSQVTAWSNTEITIRVPSRATTGNILVSAPGGTSNGAPFTFYPFPSVTAIAPSSGAVGTPVNITGVSLLDGGGLAQVTFNGTPATIISDTAIGIQVNVPAGATSGPVLVKVNGITVSGPTSFTVTPPPA